MIRRKLKNWLPTPESILETRWLRWAAPVLSHPRLWHLHRRAVALGVAIGLVTGLFPGPFQMIGATLIAIPLRANIPAAVFATLYTNPITFVPLYILAYHIGALFMGGEAAPVVPPEMSWSWQGLTQLLPSLVQWISSLGATLLLGLAIQSTVFAVTGYALTMLLWRVAVTWAWRTRHQRRARRHHL
jgi:hypothetical protein